MPAKTQETVAELPTVEVSEVRIETYAVLPEHPVRDESAQAILAMRLDGWRIASVIQTYAAQILIVWER